MRHTILQVNYRELEHSETDKLTKYRVLSKFPSKEANIQQHSPEVEKQNPENKKNIKKIQTPFLIPNAVRTQINNKVQITTNKNVNQETENSQIQKQTK